MQFLDLNLETINYIYGKLTAFEQAKLSISCKSLQYLYPIEEKQLRLKKQVLSDISAINYRTHNNKSKRIDGEITVKYYLYGCSDTELLQIYYDGDSENKFRIKNDSELWKVRIQDISTIYKRKTKCGISFEKKIISSNRAVWCFVINHK